MAELRPRGKQGAKTKDVLALWADTEGKNLPQTFIAGRGIHLQLAKVERDLFTALEEAESPNYLVYELRRKVKEVDFAAFTFAVTQTLYNQSYLSKNTDTNSGLERAVDNALQRQTGKTFFGGTIATTLKDLCRLAYGVEEPSSDQRNKIGAIIDILDRNKYELSLPYINDKGEKDRIRAKDKLSSVLREATRESDGAKYFVLWLHPVFCSLADGFIEAPQNMTKQLTAVTGTKTAAHYHLLRVLLLNRKPPKFPPLVRYTETLLEELGLIEASKQNPSRTEKQLLSICRDIKGMGIITDFEAEKGRKGRRKSALIKLTFHYDPEYIRKVKDDEPKQSTETGAGA